MHAPALRRAPRSHAAPAHREKPMAAYNAGSSIPSDFGSRPDRCSGSVPQIRNCRSPGNAVDHDVALARLSAHRPDAVVDLVILDRRRQARSAPDRDRSAPGSTVNRQRVVVDAECADRRRHNPKPDRRCPSPRRTAARRRQCRRRRYRHSRSCTPRAATCAARSSIAASGSPAGASRLYGIARPDRLGSPPPTSRSAFHAAVCVRSAVRQDRASGTGNPAPAASSASAVVNSLALDAGTKQMVRIAFEQHAGSAPDRPSGYPKTRCAPPETYPEARRSVRPEPIPVGGGQAAAPAATANSARGINRPVTFDSSQISRSSADDHAGAQQRDGHHDRRCPKPRRHSPAWPARSIRRTARTRKCR